MPGYWHRQKHKTRQTASEPYCVGDRRVCGDRDDEWRRQTVLVRELGSLSTAA